MSSIIDQQDDLVAEHRLEQKLLEQYKVELASAPFWKRWLIRLRIRRKISRAFIHRV